MGTAISGVSTSESHIQNKYVENESRRSLKKLLHFFWVIELELNVLKLKHRHDNFHFQNERLPITSYIYFL